MTFKSLSEFLVTYRYSRNFDFDGLFIKKSHGCKNEVLPGGMISLSYSI